jgi:ABC-type uncharacterized transport system substrate-binding protein
LTFKRIASGRRNDLGYVEGKNVHIEARSPTAMPNASPEVAAALARLPVDVSVGPNDRVVRAAKEAPARIPIVMANVFDPVELGFVESLARPGQNITGLANLTVEQPAKNLQRLKEAIPPLSKVAVLLNACRPNATAIWKENSGQGYVD